MTKNKPYGQELFLDLYECNVNRFNHREIDGWLGLFCLEIGVEREDLHFWDYDGVPKEELFTEAHLLGTSAVQFITTSNIIIHTLDMLGECYINIFSCKRFDIAKAVALTVEWFGSKKYEYKEAVRGRLSKCKDVE